MNNNRTRYMTALAAASLLSLPLTAGAQPPATQPPPAQPPVTQQPPPSRPAPPSQQPPAPMPPPTTDPTTQPPTAQPPATPPTTGTSGESAQTPTQTTPSGGATVLLDRISDLVDQALGVKPATKSSAKGTPGATGTSGVKVGKTVAGKVSVDRAALDEIKAEIEQLRIMLKDKDKPQ